MNIFRYKGFIGSIEINPEDKCLYGKLLYINDLITYEANTVSQLEKEFKAAVNEYIESCKKINREPMKPFKGSLNVRIGPELHKEIALYASLSGISLNDYIKKALRNQILKENT